MLTTLPLEAFVCREVMLNFFNPTSPHSTPRHFLYTTGLVIAAVLLSLTTCDLGAVFELIGATSAAALAYIFPPLCYLWLAEEGPKWRRWAAWVCVGFGIAVLVVSSVLAVGRIVSGELPLSHYILHSLCETSSLITYLLSCLQATRERSNAASETPTSRERQPSHHVYRNPDTAPPVPKALLTQTATSPRRSMQPSRLLPKNLFLPSSTSPNRLLYDYVHTKIPFIIGAYYKS